MNQLTIIGNLTSDPTMRDVSKDYKVCSFTVAVNDKRGKEEKTNYFRISAWNKLGAVCEQHLVKGRKVAVVGSVSLNEYTNKDGEHRASLEVNAENVEFLSPKNDASIEEPIKKSKSSQDDDSLPF